jgi:hypothetical protein
MPFGALLRATTTSISSRRDIKRRTMTTTIDQRDVARAIHRIT